MNEHNRLNELLPLYISGALERDDRAEMEKHLGTCAECRQDLALWETTGAVISADDRAVRAPKALSERAVEIARRAGRQKMGGGLRWAAVLLASQARLVQREIWPASAAVTGLGFLAAVIAEQAGFVYALAPLVAAACIAMIYGPENDPAFELSISTPTSTWQILLARLALVYGYNLGLVLVAGLGLLPLLGQPLVSSLALTWLAPMTFLSAAALVLSLWLGTNNAISITYLAWLGKIISGPVRSPKASLGLPEAIFDGIAAYQGLWQSPAVLFGLSAGLVILAVWMAGRQGRGLPQATN